jgi:hypothetical protein
MTQEERELLLKDLCGRLPYGVICDRLGKPKKLLSISPYKVYCFEFDNGEYMPSEYKLDDIKPYLRPMSSMTEEEKIEYNELLDDCKEQDRVDYNITILDDSMLFFVIDWLNKKMFDYRGLIPMGLALPAKEGMYE